jgi:hypothetical protein
LLRISGTAFLEQATQQTNVDNDDSNQKCLDSAGLWKVPYNGKASFSVVIDGVEFAMKPETIVVERSKGYCVSGMQMVKKGNIGVLGEKWMLKVVILHDYTDLNAPVAAYNLVKSESIGR